MVVGPSEELGLFYRRCLRTLLGVGSHVRNEVVYALTGRLPVHVHLSKALLRYARSLAAHPRRATDIYQWAQGVEHRELPEYAKYKGKTTFGRLVRFVDRATEQGLDETGRCAAAVGDIRACLAGVGPGAS